MSRIFYGIGKYKTFLTTETSQGRVLSPPTKLADEVSCNKRAQSFLEYAMLIVVISAALIAMSRYIQRAVNARLKLIQLELNESKR
jgi:Flp pilus assembly pilin Flp